jgi:hypothetical protein
MAVSDAGEIPIGLNEAPADLALPDRETRSKLLAASSALKLLPAEFCHGS